MSRPATKTKPGTNVTAAEIFDAADSMVSDGDAPTYLAVRERLGGRGSLSTITKYMKQWASTGRLAKQWMERQQATALRPVRLDPDTASKVVRLAEQWGIEPEDGLSCLLRHPQVQDALREVEAGISALFSDISQDVHLLCLEWYQSKDEPAQSEVEAAAGFRRLLVAIEFFNQMLPPGFVLAAVGATHKGISYAIRLTKLSEASFVGLLAEQRGAFVEALRSLAPQKATALLQTYFDEFELERYNRTPSPFEFPMPESNTFDIVRERLLSTPDMKGDPVWASLYS